MPGDFFFLNYGVQDGNVMQGLFRVEKATLELQVYNGSQWVAVAGGGSGGSSYAKAMSTAQRMAYVPAAGSLIWDTDLERLFIGDSHTAGGIDTTDTNVKSLTTAQREAMVPKEGELIWDRTLSALFIGDGTTAGGVSIGGGGGSGIVAGYRLDFDQDILNFNPITPITVVSGNTVTLAPDTAYKAYATSSVLTINANPPAAGYWGLESHMELFVASTGNVLTGANVILTQQLEPDAVNNLTIRFHDGLAIISVEDHVAGYIVTLAGGTASGSVYYGLTTENEYISFSAPLDGEEIDIAGATTYAEEKHLVGNGKENTLLSGTLTVTDKLYIVACTIAPITIDGTGSLVFADAVIDLTGNTNSTPVAADDGVTIEKDVVIIDAAGGTVTVDPRTYAGITKEGDVLPANYVYGYGRAVSALGTSTQGYVPIELNNNVISKVAALNKSKMSCHERRVCVMDDCATRHVNYYLNPEDLTKKLNGTPSKLDGTDGDVMTEFMPGYYLTITLTPQNDTEQRECVLMSRYPFSYTDGNNVEHVAAYHKSFKISPKGDTVRPQYMGYYQASTELVKVAGELQADAASDATSVKLTIPDITTANYFATSGTLIIDPGDDQVVVTYSARSYSGGVFTFTCSALGLAKTAGTTVQVMGHGKLRSVCGSSVVPIYPTVNLRLGPASAGNPTADSFLVRAENNGGTICNEAHYEWLYHLFICDKLTANTQSVSLGLCNLSGNSWSTLYPRPCGYTNKVANFYGGSTFADENDIDILPFWSGCTITANSLTWAIAPDHTVFTVDPITGVRTISAYGWKNDVNYIYTKYEDHMPAVNAQTYSDSICDTTYALVTAVNTGTGAANRCTATKYFIENPWGSLWQNLAGFTPMVMSTAKGYFETMSTNRYKDILLLTHSNAGTTVPADGDKGSMDWVAHTWPLDANSAATTGWVLTWNMDTFIPLTLGSGAMNDYFYNSSTNSPRAGFRGGDARNASHAGLGSLSVDNAVGSAYVFCSARLSA